MFQASPSSVFRPFSGLIDFSFFFSLLFHIWICLLSPPPAPLIIFFLFAFFFLLPLFLLSDFSFPLCLGSSSFSTFVSTPLSLAPRLFRLPSLGFISFLFLRYFASSGVLCFFGPPFCALVCLAFLDSLSIF
jgi:hypothetical protein